MNYTNYYWPDSDVIKISIEYDSITLLIENDALGQLLCMNCKEVLGVTNLSMWDDTHICRLSVTKVSHRDSKLSFLNQIYDRYGENYMPKPLKTEVLDLEIELSNMISFHIYCNDIIVTEKE